MKEAEGQPSKSNILYISGMPRAGKTTVAELLAKQLEGRVINEFVTPIPNWVIYTREESNFWRKSCAQCWTLRQHMKKNMLITDLDSPIVIVDRTWVDTLIYSITYGKRIARATLKSISNKTWLPGIYLIFVVRPEIARIRYYQSMEVGLNDWDEQWEQFSMDLYETSISVAKALGILTIDTSDASIEDVTDEVSNIFLNSSRLDPTYNIKSKFAHLI